jgi:ATP-dependent Clp protease ATP-binding subunit ClpC
LIAEPDGVGGQVLRSLGADTRLTRRAVAAALAGYVHLRAQTPPSATGDEAVAALSTAIRQELQPLVTRIERLEEKL